MRPGAVELEKLPLKRDAFRQLDLPVDIKTGLSVQCIWGGVGGSGSEAWPEEASKGCRPVYSKSVRVTTCSSVNQRPVEFTC